MLKQVFSTSITFSDLSVLYMKKYYYTYVHLKSLANVIKMNNISCIIILAEYNNTLQQQTKKRQYNTK